METKELDSLMADLDRAGFELDAAKTEESHARNRVASAVNAINGIQKQIDRIVDEIRKNAPRESDWAAKKGLVP